MKKALIMGINGTFGSHVAKALAQQGWQLKAMVRNPEKMNTGIAGIEMVRGDAANIDDIRHAAESVEIIVYGVSPANYNWQNKAIPWLENAATVAEEKKLTLIFPGNVYVFDPKDGPFFTDKSPMHPITEKGQTRLSMEQRLKKASHNGAKVIIVRAGDFIAADAKSAWLQQLIRRNKKGYTLSVAGSFTLPHTWTYVPDLAKAVAELTDKRDALQDFNIFHFEGYRASFSDIANAITQITGSPVKTSALPWWMFRAISPFSALFRGLIEMSYLWREEVSLSEDKWERILGHRPYQTPLAQALMATGLIGNRKAHEGVSSPVNL